MIKHLAKVLGFLCLILVGNHALSGQDAPANQLGKPKRVDQVGLFYQPNNVEPGIRSFSPGDEILSQPTMWGISAKLDRRQLIETSGGQLPIEAGVALPGVRVSNLPGGSDVTLVFCTVAKLNDVSTTTGLLGVLGTKLVSSLTDGQKCLWDSDGDGNADRAFLLNKGSVDDRRPAKIPPVALNIQELRESGPEERVFISLSKRKTPEFVIDIVQQGDKQNFDVIETGGSRILKKTSLKKDTAFPLDLEIYGAKLKILSFDSKNRQLQIEFGNVDKFKLINVPTKTVISYRYY